MNEEARIKLMSFHDGELDGAELAEAEALIERDPSARSELARLDVVGELVRGAHGRRALSVDLADAVIQRVLVEVPARGVVHRARPRWQRYAPVGVVLAAAAIAGLFLASPRETPGPSAARAPSALAPSHVAAVAPQPREEPAKEPAEAGVSIQTVDFGSTQGAIFLVSAGETETMVVWTLEDAKDKG